MSSPFALWIRQGGPNPPEVRWSSSRTLSTVGSAPTNGTMKRPVGEASQPNPSGWRAWRSGSAELSHPLPVSHGRSKRLSLRHLSGRGRRGPPEKLAPYTWDLGALRLGGLTGFEGANTTSSRQIRLSPVATTQCGWSRLESARGYNSLKTGSCGPVGGTPTPLQVGRHIIATARNRSSIVRHRKRRRPTTVGANYRCEKNYRPRRRSVRC